MRSFEKNLTNQAQVFRAFVLLYPFGQDNRLNNFCSSPQTIYCICTVAYMKIFDSLYIALQQTADSRQTVGKSLTSWLPVDMMYITLLNPELSHSLTCINTNGEQLQNTVTDSLRNYWYHACVKHHLISQRGTLLWPGRRVTNFIWMDGFITINDSIIQWCREVQC